VKRGAFFDEVRDTLPQKSSASSVSQCSLTTRSDDRSRTQLDQQCQIHPATLGPDERESLHARFVRNRFRKLSIQEVSLGELCVQNDAPKDLVQAASKRDSAEVGRSCSLNVVGVTHQKRSYFDVGETWQGRP
jgi:hypothetical protein